MQLVGLTILIVAGCAVSATTDDCNYALGMETGDIKDSALSASSSFDAVSVGPQNARIRTENAGGSWCPQTPISAESYEWLQINLQRPRFITAVETQGRYGNGNGLEYTPSYIIEYWRPGLDHWVRYKDREGNEILSGNTDTQTPVLRELLAPILASKVRFVPWSEHPRQICLRVELYGCDFEGNVRSYSIPQGVKKPGLDLRDLSYDGSFDEKSQRLSGGQGQLLDGRLGSSNYSRSPYEWVGWKKAISGHAGSVDMLFEFAEVRNFSSISFHCSNQFRDQAEVFAQAKIWFGFQKDKFFTRTEDYHYTRDTVIDKPRWVRISIPQRVGQYVRVELTFGAQWLLISEVQFDSTPVKGNMTIIDRNSDVTDLYPIMFTSEDPNTLTTDGIIFTLSEMPPQYIGLIVGISIAVAGLCAAIVLIVMLKHRSVSAPAPYSSVYTNYRLGPAVTASTGSSKDVQIVLKTDGQVMAKPVPSMSSSFYVLDSEACRLPSSPPPKHAPSGMSPPPDYSSNSSESSEYADPDCPTKSSAEIPLLPPPPTSQRRRPARNNLNLDVSARNSNGSEMHYAASAVTTSLPSTSAKYDNAAVVLSPMTDVVQIPRHKLRFREKLGEGEFGEVHLCQLDARLPVFSTSNLVAVKLLRKTASIEARNDFEKEMHVLSKLKDANIVQLIGVCTSDEPLCMVIEYMEHGDLNQYLQKHADLLGFRQLLHIAQQIASGMKYLESLNFVHRDLATRNCLVGGDDCTIKIADFGMSRSLYSADYYRIEGRFVLPIRWMAWESILLGKFTPKTDIWAFGVCLWEIFTYARNQPFIELNDDQVVANIQHIYHTGVLLSYLQLPELCPRDVYELMLDCWHRDAEKRPNFGEVLMFLQRKTVELDTAKPSPLSAALMV